MLYRQNTSGKSWVLLMILMMKQFSAAPTGLRLPAEARPVPLAIAFGRGPRQGGCVSGRCAGRTAAPLPTDLVAAGAVAAPRGAAVFILWLFAAGNHIYYIYYNYYGLFCTMR